MREDLGPFGKDIREPELHRWPDNGRIEIVTDPNWIMPDGKPRIVRRVGWRQCMTNKRHRFFSEDMSRQRICPVCKNVKTDETFQVTTHLGH